jgi:hypothetical protein
MIRQVVVMRWAEDVGAAGVNEVTKALEEFLETTRAATAYWHGEDIGLGQGTWDYGVVLDFDDAAAWERFHAHPDHDTVRDLLGLYAAERAAVRFQI